jgi:hypothetical protein
VKGVIAACLAELVEQRFGRDKWERTLERAGLSRASVFLATEDVDDAAVLKVVELLCAELEISLPQAADAFGEYWMTEFAPRIYGAYFRGIDNARQFLEQMDEVHRLSTERIEGARPPRFDYEWQDHNTLVMTYKSHRGLMDFAVGLIKGVGVKFGESLEVQRLSDDKVRVTFP